LGDLPDLVQAVTEDGTTPAAFERRRAVAQALAYLAVGTQLSPGFPGAVAEYADDLADALQATLDRDVTPRHSETIQETRNELIRLFGRLADEDGTYAAPSAQALFDAIPEMSGDVATIERALRRIATDAPSTIPLSACDRALRSEHPERIGIATSVLATVCQGGDQHLIDQIVETGDLSLLSHSLRTNSDRTLRNAAAIVGALVEAGHDDEVAQAIDLALLENPLQADSDHTLGNAALAIGTLVTAGQDEAIVRALDLSLLANPLRADSDRALGNAVLAIGDLVKAGYGETVVDAINISLLDNPLKADSGRTLRDAALAIGDFVATGHDQAIVQALDLSLLANPLQADADHTRGAAALTIGRLVASGHDQAIVQTLDLSLLANPLEADAELALRDAATAIATLVEAGHDEPIVQAIDLSLLANPLQTDSDLARANAAAAIGDFVQADHDETIVQALDLSLLANPLQADSEPAALVNAVGAIGDFVAAGHGEMVVDVINLSLLENPLQADSDSVLGNAALVIGALFVAGHDDAIIQIETTGDAMIIDRLTSLATANEPLRQGPAAIALTELLITRPADLDLSAVIETLLQYQQTVNWADVDFENTVSLTELREGLVERRSDWHRGYEKAFLTSTILPAEMDDASNMHTRGEPPENEPAQASSSEIESSVESEQNDLNPGPVSPARLAQAFHAVTVSDPDTGERCRDGLANLAEVSHAPTHQTAIDALHYLGSQAALPPLNQSEGFQAQASTPVTQ
jgi:hypothetical protein